MKELKFPLLTKDDIELRIGQMSKDGKKASLLLYQDARCAFKYLDMVVGAYNWQKRYYEVRGLVICSIGIYNEETKEWIWKDDTGSSGTIEEEKSIISDSTKRAAVVWGLARELYTAPNIWVEVSSKYDKFYVKSIGYNDKREISSLEIVNDKNEVVYTYGMNSPKVSPKPSAKKPSGDMQVVLDYMASVPTSKQDQLKEWFYRAVGKREINLMDEEDIKYLANKIKEKVVQ